MERPRPADARLGTGFASVKDAVERSTTSCCPRRTSRSTSPPSKRPGWARSSPTSCAPARRRSTSSRASPPTRARRSSTRSTRRRSPASAACSSTGSWSARRRSPTSTRTTRSHRSRWRRRRHMPAAVTSPQYEDLLTSDALAALARATPARRALGAHVRARRCRGGRARDAGELGRRPRDGAHRAQRPARQPLIRPVTLDQLFASVPAATGDDEPVVRNVAPHDPAPFPVARRPTRPRRRSRPRCSSTVGGDDPDVAAGAQALRLALSTDNTPAQANADLAVVTDSLAARAKAASRPPAGASPSRPARPTSRSASSTRPANRSPCACTSRARSSCSPTARDTVLDAAAGHDDPTLRGRGAGVRHLHDDGDAADRRRRAAARRSRADVRSLRRVQRRRHGAHRRRAPVPRAVVGEPLPAHAPRPPRRRGTREHRRRSSPRPRHASSGRARSSRSGPCSHA